MVAQTRREMEFSSVTRNISVPLKCVILFPLIPQILTGLQFFYLHPTQLNTKDGDSMFFWNVDIHLQNSMVSQLERSQSSIVTTVYSVSCHFRCCGCTRIDKIWPRIFSSNILQLMQQNNFSHSLSYSCSLWTSSMMLTLTACNEVFLIIHTPILLYSVWA